MALGKGPSALQRPLPSPGYRIRHLGDQAACKEGESSESASVQVRDAGVGRMLGCEPCSLSVQFIPVSSAGSWRASMLGPLSEERGVQRAEQQGGCLRELLLATGGLPACWMVWVTSVGLVAR